MKAILLTDMPEHCNDCTFRTGDNRGNYWCHALLPRLKLGHIDGTIPRHIKCPLKALPREMAVEHRWYSEDFAKGYNACLYEISVTEEPSMIMGIYEEEE